MPYVPLSGGSPCDSEFEIGVDYVYVPFTRLNGNLTELNMVLEPFKVLVDLLSAGKCTRIVLRGLCFYYYPPCGNSTHFVPPPALCYDDCVAAQTDVCPTEYDGLHNFVATTDLDAVGLNIVNCSDPGEFINPLPHCCYTAIGKLFVCVVYVKEKVSLVPRPPHPFNHGFGFKKGGKVSWEAWGRG